MAGGDQHYVRVAGRTPLEYAHFHQYLMFRVCQFLDISLHLHLLPMPSDVSAYWLALPWKLRFEQSKEEQTESVRHPPTFVVNSGVYVHQQLLSLPSEISQTKFIVFCAFSNRCWWVRAFSETSGNKSNQASGINPLPFSKACQPPQRWQLRGIF